MEFLFGSVILVAVVWLIFLATGMNDTVPDARREYAYALFLIAGFFVTPQLDTPLDILALALPAVALFEVSMFAARVWQRV